jgi:hypothetical protein
MEIEQGVVVELNRTSEAEQLEEKRDIFQLDPFQDVAGRSARGQIDMVWERLCRR